MKKGPISVINSVDIPLDKPWENALLISEAYKEGIFNNFNKYCHTNNLQRMGDLKDFDFTSLSNIRGFGEVRINKIITRYNSVMFGNSLIPGDVYTQNSNITVLTDNAIDDVFHENKFRIFRQFCSDNGILTIAGLEHLDFKKLLSVDGIGIKKFAQIKDRYMKVLQGSGVKKLSWITSINKDIKKQNYYIHRENAFLISEVYKEGIFNNFNKYCCINNLQRMGDLKGFDFTSLYNIRGFGEVRINKIITKYNSVMFGNSSIPGDVYARDSSITVLINNAIDDVFHENKYRIFRQFCSDNGILTIADLECLDFERLLSVDGIGIKKLAQVKDRYMEVSQGNDVKHLSWITGINKDIKKQNYYIHTDYLDIDISFAYEKNVSEVLRKRNIKTIPDIAYISADNFKDVRGMGKKRISEALEKVKLFELPIREFVSASLKQIRKKNEYQSFREVAYNKKTLKQVGIEHGLTRERIRQKKNKIEKYAFPVIELFEEVLIRKGMLKDMVFFDFEYLSELIGSYDNAMFAKYIFANCKLRYIRYSVDFDLFFVNKDPGEIKIRFKNIIKKIGNIFSFTDDMELIERLLIEEEISFINVFSFSDYLSCFGYKKYGDYYIKGRPFLDLILEIVMKKYFNNGIENTPEDIAKLREYINKEFGIQFSDEENDRNLWVILDRPKSNTILWGKSKKVHIEHVIIRDSLLEGIKKRVALELEAVPSISSEYIFEQVESLLKMTGSNIYCKEALYGVLQYFFSDLFVFRKLTIKTAENKSNAQKILEDYIHKQGGYVSMTSTKEHFDKWTGSMFNAAVNLNSNILAWDNGNSLVLASSLKLSGNFVLKLQEKIDNSFIDGYTNGYMIARDARILLLKNQIKDDVVSVYSLVKYLFPEKYFFTRRPHILQEGKGKQFTTVDLILMLCKNRHIISYGEMKERLITDFAMDDVMAGNYIAKAAPHLFQIDIDRYSLSSDVIYSHDDVIACVSSVDAFISSKGYAILSEIDRTDLYRKSIDIAGTNIPINSYIAKSIITKEHSTRYRFIVRKNCDWRYDNVIIVHNTSPIITFTDAIIHLLINEFNDKENFVLSNVEHFLRERELIINKIPDEIFSSEKIIIDEYGRMSIRNGVSDVI